MSSDPISYSIDRMRLVNELFDDILDKFQISGNTYEDLRRAFFNLNSQYAGAASTISKFIGGVYVERSVIGQKGSKKPYTPVNYKDQKRAFKALDKYIFSSDNTLHDLIAALQNFYSFRSNLRRTEIKFSGQSFIREAKENSIDRGEFIRNFGGNFAASSTR